MPGWQAGLIVSAAMLALGAAAGLVGWAKRVKRPLGLTQKTLKEDAQWAKERLA
jgi:putative superfamily III holin-X